MTIELSKPHTSKPRSATVRLTAVQRRKLQGSLERQLDELGQTQAQLREEIAQALIGRRGVGTDEAEDPEGGSLAFEQAQTSSLLEQSERHVREIRAALERIEAGSYGACQSCGEPIAAGRLEARPFAALCIECAS